MSIITSFGLPKSFTKSGLKSAIFSAVWFVSRRYCTSAVRS